MPRSEAPNPLPLGGAGRPELAQAAGRAVPPLAPRPAAAAPAARSGPPAALGQAPREPDRDGVRVLLPGELHFGRAPLRLRTLLGSCVAITLWHPQRRIGGMCHYLLPSRTRSAATPLEGRFGEESVELLVRAIRAAGVPSQEFVACLYGGADTMPEHVGVKTNIGQRNIELGWDLVEHHGFQLDEVDVGDQVPRSITLDLSTGRVDLRRGAART